ncbi:hypothetical protein SAMN05192589_107124 [Paracidovorax valerianellae]|uniref:Uncharacterized protein n=1 Tax=Paracidovorax valerianellae TaxID=187868 RepID=A0A1G6VUH5_9BURK|nr:hypothetical protein SAMN05192589_107124 [Paracidovorax valerianellae]
MPEATRAYSTLIQCLYDQSHSVVPDYDHYSIFRAIDARDVKQQPTSLPRVHDFAVIWDSDHDIRIIPVLEEMLMAGLLPGVQFIGEHKGTLTIILAAPTYFAVDIEAFKAQVHSLTAAAGDYWDVRVGMFDRSPGSMRDGHQCEFEGITGLADHMLHAYLLVIDDMWKLGTKVWQGVSSPEKAQPPRQFFTDADRYVVKGHSHHYARQPVVPASPGVPPSWPPGLMPPFAHPTAARAP